MIIMISNSTGDSTVCHMHHAGSIRPNPTIQKQKCKRTRAGHSNQLHYPIGCGIKHFHQRYV